jgi:hypothetical protein
MMCKSLNMITDNAIIKFMWSNWRSFKSLFINSVVKSTVYVFNLTLHQSGASNEVKNGLRDVKLG